MKPGHILVTGAGGFVGGALAEGFARLGWEATGLDREFGADDGGRGFRTIMGDLSKGVPPDLHPVDVVVHAAWVTTDPETLGVSPTEHLRLNLTPLLAVLDYVERTRPTALVFLSSSGVFAAGDGRGRGAHGAEVEGLTDAQRATGTSYYAAQKRASELLVHAASAGSTAVHVMRLGYLFGPGEVERASRRCVSLVAGWLAAAQEGRPLAVREDDPVRDWTFTADLAPALERVVAGPPAGRPLHLGSPHIYSDRAWATLIADQVEGATLETVPAGPSVKPPMIPSVIAALRGFEWTDPGSGLRALISGMVAT
jgi:nucleoside-diphosphate-sugar epimerase